MKKLFLIVALLTPIAVFAEVEQAAPTAPVASAIPAAPGTATQPQRGYWDPGTYVGVNLQVGPAGLKQKEEFGSREWDEKPVGFAGDMFLGYKFPYLRVGGEMGFFSTSKEFMGSTISGRRVVFEEDSFFALTMMPHIFLDLDIPGWRVNPYAGFAAGADILFGTYDFYTRGIYVYSDIQSSEGGVSLNLTYALMAGLRIALKPNLELNLAYRYQDYGKVKVSAVDNELKMYSMNAGIAFKF
jgi:opacity protein-like surface antigen